MPSPSRLRLSAGALALALTLGACGAPEQQSAAPAPESTSVPATSSSPADAAASSASESSAGSTSSSADTASTSSQPAAGSATRPEAAGSSRRTADTAAPSSVAASSRASSPSGARPSASSEAQRRPAPVVADTSVVPPAQDLGGRRPGVAAGNTPVKVSTPKPAIPVERVPPAAAHPAPVAPSTSTPRPTSPSSGSSETPGASPSAAPAPAPTDPVSDAGVDCSVKRCIALTFDDGPGRYTGRLLDILKAQKVPATFYVMGQSATLNPSLIARMGAEGHQVGNHTYDHANLTTLTAAQVRKEISDTDAAVRAAGVTPSTVRAPYGALNESVLAALGGLPRAGSVTWNVDTLDWKHRTPAKTLAAVKNEARPGSIVLMHDIHSTTVDAVPAVIAHLRAQGYTFVTVDRITGGVGAGHTTGSGLHP